MDQRVLKPHDAHHQQGPGPCTIRAYNRARSITQRLNPRQPADKFLTPSGTNPLTRPPIHQYNTAPTSTTDLHRPILDALRRNN